MSAIADMAVSPSKYFYVLAHFRSQVGIPTHDIATLALQEMPNALPLLEG
jgi:hypothetical protein